MSDPFDLSHDPFNPEPPEPTPENTNETLDDNDPAFLQDIDISLEEEQIGQQIEVMDRTDDLINEMNHAGGVNKGIAIDLESFQPGIITNRFPLNGFTTEYSRTNLKVSMESAEMIMAGAKAAIFVGFVAVVGKVIQWLWKRYTNNKEDCKAVRERFQKAGDNFRVIDTIQRDIFADLGKHGAAMVEAAGSHLKTYNITDTGNPRLAITTLFVNAYEKHMRGIFSAYINEVIQSPGKHVLIKSLSHQLPISVKDLSALIEKMTQAIKGAETHSLNAGDFKVEMGIKEAPETEYGKWAEELFTTYSDLVKPGIQGNIPDTHHIAHAYFYENDIGTLSNESLGLDSVKKAIDGLEAAAKDVKLNDENSKVVREFIARSTEAWMALGKLCNILTKVRDSAIVLSKHFLQTKEDMRKIMTDICKGMANNENVDELTRREYKQRLETLEKTKE